MGRLAIASRSTSTVCHRCTLCNLISIANTGVRDPAGNLGSGFSNSGNYTVNTRTSGPTATVNVATTTMATGATSAVTIVFNEGVVDFTLADVAAKNGVLSNLTAGEGGLTWTALLPPNDGIQDPFNVVTLNNTGITNGSLVAGTGNTTSNNYSIDSKGPTATIVMADTSLSSGETSTVTITFTSIKARSPAPRRCWRLPIRPR